MNRIDWKHWNALLLSQVARQTRFPLPLRSNSLDKIRSYSSVASSWLESIRPSLNEYHKMNMKILGYLLKLSNLVNSISIYMSRVILESLSRWIRGLPESFLSLSESFKIYFWRRLQGAFSLRPLLSVKNTSKQLREMAEGRVKCWWLLAHFVQTPGSAKSRRELVTEI